MRFIINVFRFSLTLVVIGVCSYLVYEFVNKQDERSHYNSVITMINHGELHDSIPLLKKFMMSQDPSVVARAEGELVNVYKRLGDDRGLPTKDCVDYYNLALGIDPDSLNREQRELVESNYRFNNTIIETKK